MVYHLLPGNESFSASSGLAISHDIANMMRFDPTAVVVCRARDESWGYGVDRSIVIPGMRLFGRIRGRKYFPRWITSPFFRRIFRPLISALEPGDIVWCHNQPFFCAALNDLIREKKALIVYHAHNPLTDRPTRAAFRVFTPDACIFVSDAIRQKALKWIPWLKETYVVHNGADDSIFYPPAIRKDSADDVPLVLYVGRLVPIKGAHVLLAAMRTLKERKVEVRCRIVGSSFLHGTKPTSYVRKLMDKRPPNVEFYGFCPHTQVAAQFRSADIFCCPSVWEEPFGNVNIEAMACGIPVVATRVGGIPEIAAQGGVIMVAPGSVVELADAIQGLVQDVQYRNQVSSDALNSFQRRFTWATICEQYSEIANTVSLGKNDKAGEDGGER